MDRRDLADEYREITGKPTMVSDNIKEPHYTFEYVTWLEDRIIQNG